MLCYQSENENALSAVPSFHGAFSDINFPIMNKARKSTIEVKGSMVTVISKQTDQAEDLWLRKSFSVKVIKASI
jgi:hypothetical protein